MDVAERLARRLVRTPNGCLEWQGCALPAGYGVIGFNGKSALTHRVAWFLVNGPIPPGVKIRHFVCDNPPCCDETHLRAGRISALNASNESYKGI